MLLWLADDILLWLADDISCCCISCTATSSHMCCNKSVGLVFNEIFCMHSTDGTYCCRCIDIECSVGHDHQPCKNGWINWDAIWGGMACGLLGPKELCVIWVPVLHWHNQANTVGGSLLCCDAALCWCYCSNFFCTFGVTCIMDFLLLMFTISRFKPPKGNTWC